MTGGQGKLEARRDQSSNTTEQDKERKRGKGAQQEQKREGAAPKEREEREGREGRVPVTVTSCAACLLVLPFHTALAVPLHVRVLWSIFPRPSSVGSTSPRAPHF